MAKRVVSRRFLPPDPNVAEPYRLTPRLALRVGLLGMVALAVFAVLFLRLWSLQILNGEQLLRAAQNNQRRERARGRRRVERSATATDFRS